MYSTLLFLALRKYHNILEFWKYGRGEMTYEKMEKITLLNFTPVGWTHFCWAVLIRVYPELLIERASSSPVKSECRVVIVDGKMYGIATISISWSWQSEIWITHKITTNHFLSPIPSRYGRRRSRFMRAINMFFARSRAGPDSSPWRTRRYR